MAIGKNFDEPMILTATPNPTVDRATFVRSQSLLRNDRKGCKMLSETRQVFRFSSIR